MWSNQTNKKLTKRLYQKINELLYADEKHLLIKRMKKIWGNFLTKNLRTCIWKTSVFIHIFLIHLMVKTNNNNTTKAIYRKYDLAQNYNGSFIISFFLPFIYFFVVIIVCLFFISFVSLFYICFHCFLLIECNHIHIYTRYVLRI